jgi:hypothetical protein
MSGPTKKKPGLGVPKLKLLPEYMPKDVVYPPPYLQKSMLDAYAKASPAEDGTITLRPGLEIPGETVKALATFVAGYAQNRPIDFLEGFELSTNHVNKGLELFGVKKRLPKGIGVVADPDRQMFGFRIGRDF